MLRPDGPSGKCHKNMVLWGHPFPYSGTNPIPFWILKPKGQPEDGLRVGGGWAKRPKLK